MNNAIVVVIGSGVATAIAKGVGPLTLGRRPLPPWLDRCMALAGPVLLSALVATLTFSSARHLTLDARAAGLAVAGGCIALRAPLPLTVLLAALTTAALRMLHN